MKKYAAKPYTSGNIRPPDQGQRTNHAVARMPFTVSIDGVLLAGFEEQYAAERFIQDRPNAVIKVREVKRRGK